jgi:uncharacterized protein (TIGR03435 family)
LGLLACCAVYGQTPDPAIRFEVASVKAYGPREFQTGYPSIGCTGGPGTSDPGLFRCTEVTVEDLISRAFDLKPYQAPVSQSNSVVMVRAGGGFSLPGGIELSAKVPPGTTKEQIRTMLQNLLVERFKLAYHFHKKDADVYELVIAKDGPKLKEAPAENSVAPAAGGPLPPPPHPASAPRGAADCPTFTPLPGTSGTIFNKTQRCEIASAVTIDKLVDFLSQQLNQPVFDATGLKGKYDYRLSYSQPSLSAALDGEAAEEETGPPLLVALQEQLGLKLEKTKRAIDVFVIDHVEKTPTEN